MMKTICLLNDSFPPLIDGVANTVLNYAQQLNINGYNPVVITPFHSQADDTPFTYPVMRYPSLEIPVVKGYPIGIPFSPRITKRLAQENITLLHSHCPIMSTYMARQLRHMANSPLILTYHTKFDIDIANITKNKLLQRIARKILLENINACDEVWVVSRGAGENLHSLGYQGSYVVMPNGVDMPCERVSDRIIVEAVQNYDLPHNAPVYLFVGRLMWYKGLKIIIDALTQLHQHKLDFRMVFIGNGSDRTAIEQYTVQCGIRRKCIFTDAICQRSILRAWYCRSDLLLFPSTFDTNGLVVREAAACSVASVLIRDSCAAEDVTDGQNCFLIEDNAQSMAACLFSLYDSKEKLLAAGQAASRDLYISWESSVKAAMDRYQVVIEQYKGRHHSS